MFCQKLALNIYLFIKEGTLFVLFVCFVLLSHITTPPTMLLVLLKSFQSVQVQLGSLVVLRHMMHSYCTLNHFVEENSTKLKIYIFLGYRGMLLVPLESP
jgi:hypothetical protein